MQNIKTIPQLAVQNLPADLESKADADEVVLLTGNQTVEGNKNLTETPVIQLWNADINPTANQTIVFSINSLGTFELYKNKTGNNGSNPPAQDGTNWEFISTCQGSRAYVQEFAASESPVSSVTLTEGVCYNADFMTVAVDHTILDPSAYTLGINGTTITFDEPVQAGLTITVRWFTEMNLSNVYRQPLLTCFWSDHLIYELSYLCADPFSWQDGNVYSAVYNHLVADIDGKSTTTEGSITYYLADDGHKIATAASHDAVADLYDETGVAWFYILDTTNHRFKLPRTKYTFNGWRGDVGDYIPESLPNITGANLVQANNTSGCFYGIQNASISTAAGTGTGYGTGFNASRSSSTYQNGAPVQQRGTQMYLYFYVGNYTPQAIEQTAGYAQTLTELKADKDLANSPYTTNRILEIPQNIKLELNNGTLTLKAGSKVYIPNGSGIFDSFTLLSDAGSGDISGISTDYLFFVNSVGGLSGGSKEGCYSGTVEPTGTNGVFWYDTTNNVVKRHNGTSWVSGYSLPFCVISSGASSIDQVFNGFGYIGSTVFALPGVKCQSTFERNADGTYKSDIIIVDKVLTGTRTDTSKTLQFYIQKNTSNEISLGVSYHYYTSKTVPTTGAIYSMVWCEEDGCWYFSNAENSFSKVSFKVLRVITCETDENGKITSFKPYNVDSVLNSSLSNLSATGQAKFDAKANVSNTVTTDTAQTISGVKTFSTAATLRALNPLLLKENNENEGGQIHFERSNNSVLKGDPYIDLWQNVIRFIGISSQNVTNFTMQLDLENNKVFVPTPVANANDAQVATTSWVNSKIQLVSEAPAQPETGVLYVIPES